MPKIVEKSVHISDPHLNIRKNNRVLFCYFLQCDHTNTGVSDLCDLSSGDLNPSIWAQAARSEFENQTGSVPDFLQKGPDNATTRMTNRRLYVPDPD